MSCDKCMSFTCCFWSLPDYRMYVFYCTGACRVIKCFQMAGQRANMLLFSIPDPTSITSEQTLSRKDRGSFFKSCRIRLAAYGSTGMAMVGILWRWLRISTRRSKRGIDACWTLRREPVLMVWWPGQLISNA